VTVLFPFFLCFFNSSLGFSSAFVIPWSRHLLKANSFTTAVATTTTQVFSANAGSFISLPSTSKLDQETVEDQQDVCVITNVLLCISYDGGRFTGWSAANSIIINSNTTADSNATAAKSIDVSRRKRRRGILPEQQKGFVRPVEGVLRKNLASLFGKVDPDRIVVEACSRTDKGVHAREMMVLAYCLTQSAHELLQQESPQLVCSIPGKRKPHPITATDTSYFEALPMGSNLSRIAFALNRMLPADVRVTGIAPTPALPQQDEDNGPRPFHPSLRAKNKTYQYTISVGGVADPTAWRFTWHIDSVPDGTLDVDAMNRSCQRLQGTHDFCAFQGAPRGPEDKRRRDEQQEKTICTLSSVRIDLQQEDDQSLPVYPGINPPLTTYVISVTGDRFLYKMNRFIVGALVAVGTGKLEVGDLERSLEMGSWEFPDQDVISRTQFECAPPHGLVLSRVDYGDLDIDWRPLHY
jgi:tRNA pseudouridine38-40 synthase